MDDGGFNSQTGLYFASTGTPRIVVGVPLEGACLPLSFSLGLMQEINKLRKGKTGSQ